MQTYQRCREEYRLSYLLGFWPLQVDDKPLAFGSAIHAGLEAWWTTLDLEHAIRVAVAYKGPLDAYDRVMVRVLLCGYDAMWRDAAAEWTSVQAELPFNLAGHGYGLTGKIDIDGVRGGRPVLAEHKTTSAEDVAAGSTYWETLNFDWQVGLYLDAASRLGDYTDTVCYDVIRKPKIKPHRETPEAERKYCKTGPRKGLLHANQYERDETPEEYGERVAAKIAAKPEAYYVRQDVVRLSHEVERLRDNVHQLATEMVTMVPERPAPPTTKSCRRFGGQACPYLGVCGGTVRLDNPAVFGQRKRN